MVLDVQLWKSVFFKDGSFRDISDGSLFNHVADQESLDGFIFRNASVAVEASN